VKGLGMERKMPANRLLQIIVAGMAHASGAEAPYFFGLNVAAEAATHKTDFENG